jgi:hypothetical protein
MLPMINCNSIWQLVLQVEHWLHEWVLRHATHSPVDADIGASASASASVIIQSFFGKVELLQIGVSEYSNKPMCSLLVTCNFTWKMLSSTHSGLLLPSLTPTCC